MGAEEGYLLVTIVGEEVLAFVLFWGLVRNQGCCNLQAGARDGRRKTSRCKSSYDAMFCTDWLLHWWEIVAKN